MTYSILLAVEQPKDENGKLQRRWEECAPNLKEIVSKNKDVRLLGECTVLIPLHPTLDTLSEVLWGIRDLPYTYSIFSEEIEWHRASKKG